mmetsp:Transcript_102619/g.331121  ORF Transcript_102619/g.331121 Transcript_102619/m.331121 type:complete len:209 (-) Transcript_102619:395-1021(-)
MAARDQTSCAQSWGASSCRPLARASPWPASTAPWTMSRAMGKRAARLTTSSCTTHSRQTCQRCLRLRPSSAGQSGTSVSRSPRQMLSTQKRKKGLGQVPVVRLIQKGSSFSPSFLPAPPSPSSCVLRRPSSRMSETMQSIASTSAGSSVGSPATPSNLNMFTRALRRKSCTAALKRAAYLGPASEKPCSFVSKPCRRPSRRRSSLAWP